MAEVKAPLEHLEALTVEHLWELPDAYREAHASYTFLLSRGVPTESIPPRIRERERIYQLVAKRRRRGPRRTT